MEVKQFLTPGTAEYGAFFNRRGGGNKAQIADKVKEGQRIDPPSSSKTSTKL